MPWERGQTLLSQQSPAMEKLCGVDSLLVVYHRFSDGVEVVKCALEFYKEVAEAERSYSSSIHKLLRSSAYNFHSNILMQWLGSEPYEEIGTLKHSWQELGNELCKLADLHAEKADAYLDTVRKPLLDLLPQLEETRRVLKIKMQQMKVPLENAQRRHTREKQKYLLQGESYDKLQTMAEELKGSLTGPSSRLKKLEARLVLLLAELKTQETIYQEAHTDLLGAHETFDNSVVELYKNTEAKELERVNTLKQSLQEFVRTLSNTAPVYLESMQQMVVSIGQVDGTSDIDSFVQTHKEFLTQPPHPEFEKHNTKEIQLTNGNATDDRETEARTYEHEEGSSDNSDAASIDEETTKINPKKTNGSPPTSTRENGLKSNGKKTKRLEKTGPVGTEGGMDAQDGRPLKPHGSTARRGEAKDESDSSISRSHVANVIQRMESHHESSLESSTTKRLAVKPTRVVKPLTTPKPRPGDIKIAGILPPLPPVPRHGNNDVTITNNDVSRNSRTRSDILQTQTGEVSITQTASKFTKSTSPAFSNKVTHEEPDVKSLTQRKAEMREKQVAVHGRATNSRSPRLQRKGDPHLEQLLSQLQQLAATNDYYGLLGVDPDCSTDDLAKARREKSRLLHPDHFGNDPDRRAKAEEQLVMINQVFQDVLKTQENRTFYDTLCHFRKAYTKVVHQKPRGLESAERKLVDLHRSMKKTQMPLRLLEEIQMALKLIRTCRQNATES